MLPEGVTSITMHIDVDRPNRHNLDLLPPPRHIEDSELAKRVCYCRINTLFG